MNERALDEIKMVGQQRSRKVMLVEDFEVDRQIYRRYLQADLEHQYSFVESEAQEALTIPDSDWTEIDIVLLDYQLPDINGIDWSIQWQQQYQHLNLPPAIALTGQGNENIAVEFIKLGAGDGIEF